MCTNLSRENNCLTNQPQGPAECILDLLEKLGPVPVDLQINILTEKNQTILRNWYILAARAESLDQFIQEM